MKVKKLLSDLVRSSYAPINNQAFLLFKLLGCSEDESFETIIAKINSPELHVDREVLIKYYGSYGLQDNFMALLCKCTKRYHNKDFMDNIEDAFQIAVNIAYDELTEYFEELEEVLVKEVKKSYDIFLNLQTDDLVNGIIDLYYSQEVTRTKKLCKYNTIGDKHTYMVKGVEVKINFYDSSNVKYIEIIAISPDGEERLFSKELTDLEAKLLGRIIV